MIKGDFTFSPLVAREYGVEQAVLIRHLQYWITYNAANDVNFYDGRYWTYNSAKAFSKIFSFWNDRKIESLLKSLEEKEVVITANYNAKKYDRTKWYAFKNQEEFFEGNLLKINIYKKQEMHSQKFANASTKICEPIPDNKPNHKPYLKGKDKNGSEYRSKRSQSKFDQIAQGVYQQINNRQQD